MNCPHDCGRSIYLRLSVTDRCNLRCRYCRPPGSDEFREGPRATDAELLDLVAAIDRAAQVAKLRLTGGEPLVHTRLPTLVSSLRRILPTTTLAVTTNGTLLPRQAAALRAAGLDALNISLDSLDAAAFRALNGGVLSQTLAGLRAARAAGFAGIKLNAVLIRSVNGDALADLVRFAAAEDCEPRFIELMPYGPGAALFASDFLSADEALDRLKRAYPYLGACGQAGTALRYMFAIDGQPRPVGFITPVSHPFCDACNRWRLSSDGRLLACLRQRVGTDLLSPLRAGNRGAVQQRIDAMLDGKQAPGACQWPVEEMVSIGG